MRVFLQVILLEECWSELFLLNAIQWCIPLETNPLFNTSDHLAAIPNGKASQVAADIRILNEILHRFRLIAVDPAEFACMKAIVLFRAGKFLGCWRVLVWWFIRFNKRNWFV